MATEADKDAAIRALQDENDRLRAENDDLLETQRQLESSRQRYSELFDDASMAWVTVDGTGSIENLNLAAATLMGSGRVYLVGSPLSASVHADDRQRLREHFLAARQSNELQRCELRLASGGELIPVQLSSRRTAVDPTSFVIALLDLRQRRAEEAERQRLATAEREARAANDAKDTFIAMLSHELRTPLTPVLAVASTFSEFEELPQELRNALAVVRRNVLTEVQLIDDLLDLTRITHGKMRVEKQLVDLHRVICDVASAVQADARRAQLDLTADLAAARYWVDGDSTRLQQVLNNLLRNAIKFTQAGGQIQIRTWNRQERLLVEVSDNGRGIDADALSRLFQPFEQALHECMGSSKGLGLGLPICRGILEQHDATVVASSPGPGHGARFVIDIGAMEPPSLELKAQPLPPSPLPGTLRVLLVEDHEDTAEIFERLLRRGGYSVHVASSVQSALAVQRSTFDVLLSDVGLADGSGLELMRKLRKTGEVKGIAISGYGTEDDIRASREAGFSQHLTKPVDFSELLAAIAKLSVG
ncbi:MAG: ATP-binding protein [Pseudomonadota bacterium]